MSSIVSRDELDTVPFPLLQRAFRQVYSASTLQAMPCALLPDPRTLKLTDGPPVEKSVSSPWFWPCCCCWLPLPSFFCESEYAW